MGVNRRLRIVLPACAVLLVLAVVAFAVLRAPLERAYALDRIRRATGLRFEASRIERVANGFVAYDMAAWTRGGAFLMVAPVARIALGDELAIDLVSPRFVIAPQRVRGDERSLLGNAKVHVENGTLIAVSGAVPVPSFACDDIESDLTLVPEGALYSTRLQVLAAGGRFSLEGSSHERDGRIVANWHAAQVPLVALAQLLSPTAPLRPVGGWLRDLDLEAGTTVRASARLQDAGFTLGTHALTGLHGTLVFDRGAVGTTLLAGLLDDAQFSAAGEVHDLGPGAAWLGAGSRNLVALATLLEEMAGTPHLHSVRLEATAPGLAFGQYAFAAAHGPLAISVVAIDPSETSLHLDTAIAEDRVFSHGERTSAMGLRTGAIAGVNGDYFDIGRTYQPQGLLMQNGTLERGPTDRAALVIDRANRVHFGEFRLRGTVSTRRGTMPITELNDWPPGDVAVITPAFGKQLPASPGRTFVALEPVATGGNRYRVTDVFAMTEPRDVRFGIAIGPLVRVPLPVRGEEVVVDYDLDPHVPDARSGIGGGPILLRDGAAYEDPHAPAPEERNVRWPVIALAAQADGELLMVALDGRHPERSIGATRPEFTTLLQRLGATDAMALDSGGSVTLVGRAVGDATVSVRNVPSDFSAERWISDALFVYSSAAPASIVPAAGAPTPVPEARPTP